MCVFFSVIHTFTIMAPVVNLLTVCGEIRQTLDAKMRQLF
jgi:hypothetical protein